jgi:RIO kinase 1
LARAIPEWVIDDLFTDDDLGVIATGKEGEVNLIERTSLDTGRSILLARKRYRPRSVKKGELRAMGFERAPTFRNDIVYRDGRNYGRRSRDRRAVESMTKYGKELVKSKWSGHEFEVMRAVWDEGGRVPYPVSNDEDGGLVLEYVGDREQAAPRLAQARLSRSDLRLAWEQLVEGLRTILRAGWVHSDLSAYNVLWWHDELWIIDLPQAVDLAISPHGFEFLHRDVSNVATWFTSHGVEVDPDALYGELLAVL